MAKQVREQMQQADDALMRAGVSDRMRLAISSAGMTQAEVLRRAGVCDRTTLAKTLSRGTVPRRMEVRQAIARVLDVPGEWLWYGITPTETHGNVSLSKSAPFQRSRAATLQQESAVAPRNRLRAVDSRWAPLLRPGDEAITNADTVPQEGDAVVVWGRNGDAEVARFARMCEDGVRLVLPSGLRVSVANSDIDEISVICRIDYCYLREREYVAPEGLAIAVGAASRNDDGTWSVIQAAFIGDGWSIPSSEYRRAELGDRGWVVRGDDVGHGAAQVVVRPDGTNVFQDANGHTVALVGGPRKLNVGIRNCDGRSVRYVLDAEPGAGRRPNL